MNQLILLVFIALFCSNASCNHKISHFKAFQYVFIARNSTPTNFESYIYFRKIFINQQIKITSSLSKFDKFEYFYRKISYYTQKQFSHIYITMNNIVYLQRKSKHQVCQSRPCPNMPHYLLSENVCTHMITISKLRTITFCVVIVPSLILQEMIEIHPYTNFGHRVSATEQISAMNDDDSFLTMHFASYILQIKIK